MKAQELRIGNLLRDNLSGALLRVDNLSDNNMGFFVIDREKYPLKEGWQAGPIPLTEKWLKDLGFKKGRKGFWFQGGVEYNPKKFDLSFFGYVEIKYVHQLQNLYFALTGEELNKK